MDTLERLKQTSVSISGPSKGTGYLVAKNRVATCHHVIRDWEEKAHEIVIGFDAQLVRQAKVLRSSEETDCALLEFDEPVNVEPLPFAIGLDCRTNWDGFGFPHSAGGGGLAIRGEVLDPKNRDETGRAVIQLFSPQAAAGSGARLHGFSGTPVVVEGALVGHVIRHVGDPDDRKKPAYGVVFATPASGVIDLLDVVADTREIHPAELVELTEFINEIQRFGVVELRDRKLPESVTVGLAKLLTGQNRPGLALELLDAGNHQSLVARQQHALALAKEGRLDDSIAELRELVDGGARDAETVGLLAGRYKQLWEESGDRAALMKAHELYSNGFEETGDSYNGINAAATALYLGDRVQSAVLAARSLAATDLDAELGHWELATVGESWLLQEKFESAEDWYKKAVLKAMEQGLYQDIAVMRKQARRNLEILGREKGKFDGALPVPGVLAFAGHMLDADGRDPARFPKGKIGEVRNAVRAHLKRLGKVQGFGTAARGSDIIFLEEMVKRRIKPIVIMPFPEPAFRRISVKDWGDKLDEVRPELEVRVLEGDAPADHEIDDAFASSNKEVKRLALAHAQRLGTDPQLIVVWDGKPGDGPGGTADVVAAWKEEGIEPIIIDPTAL